MEKNQQVKKAKGLTLRKETLRLLDQSELQAVAGAGRLRVPIGYEDTVPYYDDADTTG
jgi:hypothetical protein